MIEIIIRIKDRHNMDMCRWEKEDDNSDQYRSLYYCSLAKRLQRYLFWASQVIKAIPMPDGAQLKQKAKAIPAYIILNIKLT